MWPKAYRHGGEYKKKKNCIYVRDFYDFRNKLESDSQRRTNYMYESFFSKAHHLGEKKLENHTCEQATDPIFEHKSTIRKLK